jgi:hypothetical protein
MSRLAAFGQLAGAVAAPGMDIQGAHEETGFPLARE